MQFWQLYTHSSKVFCRKKFSLPTAFMESFQWKFTVREILWKALCPFSGTVFEWKEKRTHMYERLWFLGSLSGCSKAESASSLHTYRLSRPDYRHWQRRECCYRRRCACVWGVRRWGRESPWPALPTTGQCREGGGWSHRRGWRDF